MVVAFDLDDTLYPEETFVKSGFRAVAAVLHARFGVAESEVLRVLWSSLEEKGRGSQFDDAVAALGLSGRQSVSELVSIYRHHSPAISLPPASRKVMEALQPRPLYVVTDGHKVVQANKIAALGITPVLEHAYITNRYGIRSSKPSPRVFELMARRERREPRDVLYIGDDPSKDFKGIRPLGFRTVRVLTGRHAAAVVPAEQDAERTIARIAELPAVVAELEAGG